MTDGSRKAVRRAVPAARLISIEPDLTRDDVSGDDTDVAVDASADVGH